MRKMEQKEIVFLPILFSLSLLFTPQKRERKEDIKKVGKTRRKEVKVHGAAHVSWLKDLSRSEGVGWAFIFRGRHFSLTTALSLDSFYYFILISMLASVGRFRQPSRISKHIDYNYLPLFPTSTSTAALQDSVRKLQKFNFPFTSTSDYSVRKLQSSLIIDIDNNFYLNIL